MSRRGKLGEWIARYLPAEISGTLGALLAATLVYQLSGSAVLASFAGTWGENLGYYGLIVGREAQRARRSGGRERGGPARLWRRVRDLLVEFGPAELLDSFVFRPFFMYIMPQLIGNLQLGIVLGKLAADITFYIPTIISYELRKRFLSK